MDTATREFFRNCRWNNNEIKIPNKNSFRDLGTHLNLFNNNHGAILTDRMDKGTKMTHRLQWLGISNETQSKIVQSNIVPAALYGVEAWHVNTSKCNELRTAIANVIGPKGSKRSVDMAYNMVDTNRDLDPQAYILQARILQLRRNMSKHDGRFEMIKNIFNMIQQQSCNRNHTTHKSGINGFTKWKNPQTQFLNPPHINEGHITPIAQDLER